jgi:hypothetical protein
MYVLGLVAITCIAAAVLTTYHPHVLHTHSAHLYCLPVLLTCTALQAVGRVSTGCHHLHCRCCAHQQSAGGSLCSKAAGGTQAW